MKIGLLSDTHGDLDPKVLSHFARCDEIWHAGDIGPGVVVQLEAFKPLRAVYGNIDDKDMQLRFPEDLRFDVEGINIWMTHIGGVPPRYNPRISKLLKAKIPDIFICGHSHILKIMRDAEKNNMLFLNPGAAGNHGFHSIKTMLRFDIVGGRVLNMEVIELGKRGQI
jgi:hypothetical protein